MNYKSFLACAIFACSSLSLMAQDNIKLLVGTYTNGSSKGIYSFEVNQRTGDVTALDTIEITNPSYLTLSLDGSMIYAVNETNDKNASLSTISFDTENGKMRFVNNALTKGEDPCFVDTNGNMVVTANYSGGSMSVFPLNDAGELNNMTQLFSGAQQGFDKERQEKGHFHCVRFTPDGYGVLVSDFTGDALLRYDFITPTKLKYVGIAAQLPKGSGVRHFIFSGDSRFLYVMSELSGEVTVFNYNKGKLTQKQTIATDKYNARGGADIHTTPNGNFLYVSNRLKNDGITIFKVNKATGLLTEVGFQATEKHPRQFNITPNGELLLCASKDNNTIQVFKINQDTGALTNLNKDIKIDKPVCIQFYPAIIVPDTGLGGFQIIERTIVQ